MYARLVLGCGSFGRSLIDEIRDWPGQLLVVCDEERRVDTLREEGVNASQAAPTDPDVLAGFDDGITTVFVAGDDATQNVAAASAARTAFPAAHLVAYSGADPTPSDVADLDEVADETIDRGRETARKLRTSVGDEGLQARQLVSILRNLAEPLAIVTHDNPDPDAIASAVALEVLADRVGCDADICYFGSITHQENRAFVNLLDFDLRSFDRGDDLVEEYESFALVDHSRPGVNDQLPKDTPIDIVIDHHPPRIPVDAKYVDLRSEVGATSTLMVDYLRTLGIGLDEDVATGLLFGIRVDTREFTREACPADLEAAAHLVTTADAGTLERIETPSISADTFETIANAISNRQQYGPVLLTCVGDLNDRDALAQAADRLLDLEGVTITLVYGLMDGTIYASARARGADIDLGETLRDAYGQIGSAGGHSDMAGAQITLGLLDTIDDDDESLVRVVQSVMTDRFLDAVESRTNKFSVTRGSFDDQPLRMTESRVEWVVEAGRDQSDDADDPADDEQESE
ncbi:DHH family phosphoesterase [Haloarculaceae archaeon H-GB2-1]|nr:DHH family phosphoesterase [Haloarculaceae archaeon H-GB1-1]MEA5386108.1 DHH family phosphoesterase [Haloarculaceae archaeon H-GB11]MEA5407615.1 DHH family phosphoesterase [Haloarculaceae archaeon H-GB2-1]